MKIETVELRQLALPLAEPLRSAHGVIETRPTILIGIEADGQMGWGECVALADPGYLDEWSDGEYEVLRTTLASELISSDDVTADGVASLLGFVSGHRTAKAAVEMAVLDVELRSRSEALRQFLGASTDLVACCIVVGIGDDAQILSAVERSYAAGYRTFKLKVSPDTPASRVAMVRREYPDAEFRLDANGSFDWRDREDRRLLVALIEPGVAWLEQPVPPIQNELLPEIRRELDVAITLDESITSEETAMEALERNWLDVMTVKPGPIGGLMATVKVHAACRGEGVPLTLGGMVDSGLSRAANLAVAAMPGFVGRAAEVSPDGRWFSETLLVEPVEAVDGRLAVPTVTGIGADLSREAVDRYTLRGMTLTRT